MFFSSLALPLLAALTPPEHEVTIVDDIIEDIPFEGPWDLVGITANSFNAFRAYELADEYRRRNFSVVMGGIHVSAVPEEALRHADTVFVGEADETWPIFLRKFDGKKRGEVIRPEKPPKLDGLPVPKHQILKTSRQSGFAMSALARLFGLPIYSIQTSRGCPRACDFCSVSRFYGRTHRLRPVEEVVREIRNLGARFCFFVDEDIFLPGDRARRLFEALIPLGIVWLAQAGIAAADDRDLIRLARRSGCRGVLVGIESTAQRHLDSLGKGFNSVETYEKRLRNFREASIEVEASLIFGFDGEGTDAFADAFRFLNRNRIRHTTIWPLTPLPGTRFYERLRTEGRLKEKAWWLNKDVKNPRMKFTGNGWDEAEFEARFVSFHKKFFSIGRLFKRFLMFPSRKNLFSLFWWLSQRSSFDK
jgi:radical SAM superfamily enzyme YgiQ (UPF0313 family)